MILFQINSCRILRQLKNICTRIPRFTETPVKPGEFRNVNVSVDDRSVHGPDYQDLPLLLQTFGQGYDPDQFHGDERLIAMAASHHRLTWLHPFRDGNGRVARFFQDFICLR